MKINSTHFIFAFTLLNLLSCTPSKMSNKTFVGVEAQNIIGGEHASAKNSEIAGVFYFEDSCSTLQIDEDILLTAAHCTKSSGKQKDALYLNGLGKDIFGDITAHAEYDAATITKDFAFVTLNKKVLNSAANFLLPQSEDLPEDLYVAGYGNTALEQTEPQERKLKFLKISKSKQLLHEISKESLGTNMSWQPSEIEDSFNQAIKDKDLLCFKTLDRLNNSPLYGDSGGPLYSINKEGKAVIHGVFSFFNGETEGDNKGVYFFCYQAVYKKLSWLKETIALQKTQGPRHVLSIETSEGVRNLKNEIVESVEIDTPREVSAEIIDAGFATSTELQKLDIQGKIVLVQKSEVTSDRQITPAAQIENILQKKGAAGIIIFDHSDGPVNTLQTVKDAEHLPYIIQKLDVRFISRQDGQALLQEIQQGRKVKGTLKIIGR